MIEAMRDSSKLVNGMYLKQTEGVALCARKKERNYMEKTQLTISLDSCQW